MPDWQVFSGAVLRKEKTWPAGGLTRRFRTMYVARHPGIAAFIALLLVSAAAPGFAQQSTVAPGASFSPHQLDDLVAPIALYPDPLVAQILAATTYPMEVAEAEQWERDHSHWKPSKLMDKVKKEKWDTSVRVWLRFRKSSAA